MKLIYITRFRFYDKKGIMYSLTGELNLSEATVRSILSEDTVRSIPYDEKYCYLDLSEFI